MINTEMFNNLKRQINDIFVKMGAIWYLNLPDVD